MQLFDALKSRARPGKDELFIFVHLPKTGGQTLRNCFAKHFKLHREFIHLAPFGQKDAERLGLLPFEQRPLEERMEAKVILGHSVHCQTHTLVPGKVPRHVLFLRDPAELLVSLYNFELRDEPADQPVVAFDKWLADSGRKNFMTKWLAEHFMAPQPPPKNKPVLETINAALEQFWFVGCSEFLDDDAPLLLRRIGLPPKVVRSNVAGVHYPKRLTLDDSLRTKLYADNELDVQLYRTWRDRLDESRKRLEDELK